MMGTLRESRYATESGASLVEFAILAPLLIVLLFGIVEFGYLFANFNELRHSVREGSRYAAVSNPDLDGDNVVDRNDVAKAVCDSLNLPGGGSAVLDLIILDSSGDPVSVGSTGDVGDVAYLEVTATIPTLTGFPGITSFLPSSLTNGTTFRLEQSSKWTSGGALLSC